MIQLAVLLSLLCAGRVWAGLDSAPPDCVEAEHVCVLETGCKTTYRLLEYCAGEEAVAPLGPEARRECVAAETALQGNPLLACKCQRGARREEHCLRVYWTVRYSQGHYEFEASPYEDLESQQLWSIESARMAPILSVSSSSSSSSSSVLQDAGPGSQNQCLRAAQECGLFERCGALRSEYVLACTKRPPPPATARCNRQKCHRALRRFLERVPPEYSLPLLFCPCGSALCGERRRKTIVPSCSYEEEGERPNCLRLQGYCMADDLCRSRLADFQHNCQPASLPPSDCLRGSWAACLKAYAGLIGTIMTPNYVSNSSDAVSQWCSCEGSGNDWQDCHRILSMFNQNPCLRKAISAVGSAGQHAPTAPPALPTHPAAQHQPAARHRQGGGQ
ncbi:GFRA1 protein, partial [Amia calva]|nr:GFRA1 protein [Amia calva]